MNIWITYHQSGWHVYSYTGKLLGIHGMMCNCKCHAMIEKTNWKRISNRSTELEIIEFNKATGLYYEYSNENPEQSNLY